MQEHIDPSKYCEIYLARHGVTEANRDHIMDGQVINSPLSPEGREYLINATEKLKDVHFDAIFSSDLVRAVETAEILRAERELIINTRKKLRERFFGDIEGMSWEDYAKLIAKVYPELSDGRHELKWDFKLRPEVESYEEAAERYILALREIAVGYVGKRVLVVGHGGAIRAFFVKAGFGDLSAFPPWGLENGNYARVLSDGVDFFLKETNS